MIGTAYWFFCLFVCFFAVVVVLFLIFHVEKCLHVLNGPTTGAYVQLFLSDESLSTQFITDKHKKSDVAMGLFQPGQEPTRWVPGLHEFLSRCL